MFWNYVLSFALVVVTILWGSYGVIIPLIVVRFANPLIRHLDNKGMINGIAARKRNRFTIMLWLIMDIVAITVICIIGNHYVWIGFGIGVLYILLFGVGKTGRNTNNKQDFIRSYSMYFIGNPEKVVDEIIAF